MRVKVASIYKNEMFWGKEVFETSPVPYVEGEIVWVDPNGKGVFVNLFGEPVGIHVCWPDPEKGAILQYQVNFERAE